MEERPVSKYDDERVFFSAWYIFDESPDGSVDIACNAGDVLQHVPRNLAEDIIRRRDDYLRTFGVW